MVEYIAGDKMRELGYALAARGAVARKPLRLRIRDRVDGLEWRVRRRLQRAFALLRKMAA